LDVLNGKFWVNPFLIFFYSVAIKWLIFASTTFGEIDLHCLFASFGISALSILNCLIILGMHCSKTKRKCFMFYISITRSNAFHFMFYITSCQGQFLSPSGFIYPLPGPMPFTLCFTLPHTRASSSHLVVLYIHYQAQCLALYVLHYLIPGPVPLT